MKSSFFSVAMLCLFTTDLYAIDLDALIRHYAIKAEKENPVFSDFDLERGKNLYSKSFISGKKDTPSCTTCHSKDPTQIGETRAGKVIEPMAISTNPERYRSLKKVEKWFRRNCKSVLGRECNATEKGDFLTFMKNS